MKDQQISRILSPGTKRKLDQAVSGSYATTSSTLNVNPSIKTRPEPSLDPSSKRASTHQNIQLKAGVDNNRSGKASTESTVKHGEMASNQLTQQSAQQDTIPDLNSLNFNKNPANEKILQFKGPHGKECYKSIKLEIHLVFLS